MTIRSSSSSGIPFGESSSRPINPAVGQPYFNGTQKRLEVYTSNGWQNIVSETPSVTGISGSYLESNSTNTITITGTSFSEGCVASAIGTNGVATEAISTTVTSAVEISAVFSGLSATYEPYDIRVTSLSNLYGQINNILYVNETPVWSTSAGSLGTISYGEPVSLSVSATDPEGGSITYSSSNLPVWLSLNSSNGAITGIGPRISSSTTYSFSISASDGLNSTSRSFSITLSPAISVQALIVAGGGGGGAWVGGGGGAGGIVYSTSTSVLFSSQKTIEVGAGGNRTSSYTGGFINGTNGGNSTFNGLVAIGGGVGGGYNGTGYYNGANGGSGGGATNDGSGNGATPGTGTQPSSASGGYGNNGGSGLGGDGAGAGGGGAGAAGASPTTGGYAGNGGAGLNTWSAWATATSSGASGYFAGGGGGGGDTTAGVGGAGGGGNGSKANDGQAASGVTNTGGGGGGARNSGGPSANQGGAGGSGIVIIRYPDTLDDPTQYTGTKYTSGGYKYFKYTTNGTITF